MLPKVLRTIFLALGLAMLWLGFFYQYELKEQPVMAEEYIEEESFYGELELYTLADDNFADSDDAFAGVELMPLHVTDFSVSFNPQKSLVPKIEQPQSFLPEKDASKPVVAKAEDPQAALHVQQAGVGRFPIILMAAGVFFIFCGVLSCRLSKEF